MSQNKSQNVPVEQPGKAFGLLRTILIFAMVGFLLWTLAKDNPKIRGWLDRFTSAQQAVDPNSILKIGGMTMGTSYNIQIAAPPKGWDGARLHGLVSEQLQSVDAAMTTYTPDSYVSRFNASTSTDWFEVSSETVEVVSLALEIAKETDGAFDITVAPLVNAWRFGPDKSPLTEFPSDEQIAALREKCGWQRLTVQTEPFPALKKDIPELSIDLSGIAKGYAVDKTAEALEQAGIANYLVEVGGEVRCAGTKGDVPWTLAIEKPIPSKSAAPLIYHLYRPNALALATSGSARNFSVLGQKRFSHIINPRTGRPTEIRSVEEARPEYELGSVSVFDSSCARADALATAFFVLGSQDGKILADQLNEAVLFVSRSTMDPDLFADEPSKAYAEVGEFIPNAQ